MSRVLHECGIGVSHAGRWVNVDYRTDRHIGQDPAL